MGQGLSVKSLYTNIITRFSLLRLPRYARNDHEANTIQFFSIIQLIKIYL